QSRSLTFVNREAGPRNFIAKLKINKVVFLGKLPMRQCIIRKEISLSALVHNLVIFRTKARLYRTVRQVWKLDKKFILFFFNILKFVLHLPCSVFESYGFFFERPGVFFPALLKKIVYFFVQPVRLC